MEGRLAWRFPEIANQTGLTVPFLRKQERLGHLRARRIGGAVVVLDKDLREWLEGVGEPEKAKAVGNR